jgi:hypothetical protein
MPGSYRALFMIRPNLLLEELQSIRFLVREENCKEQEDWMEAP